jgi:predicted nucleic acid-binding Zn ribbon protein
MCVICNKEFNAIKDQKCCSPECMNINDKNYRKKVNNEKRITPQNRMCPICKKISLNRLYCSKECYKKGNIIRTDRYHKTLKYKNMREKHRNTEKENRIEIIKLLGAQCINPYGEHDKPYTNILTLQIDHVNGNGNKERNFNKYNYYKYILNKIKNYSKDYQLMCANCNLIKKIKNNEK